MIGRWNISNATLTERATSDWQSRNRNLHIAPRAVGVRVHSHSAANTGVGPVRQHGDVLGTGGVVVNDRGVDGRCSDEEMMAGRSNGTAGVDGVITGCYIEACGVVQGSEVERSAVK